MGTGADVICSILSVVLWHYDPQLVMVRVHNVYKLLSSSEVKIDEIKRLTNNLRIRQNNSVA